ncbi:axin interactor, dorsalization-associated protein-like [Planoprotostelium fungivorum]|uniref:Axin interactor, dorsalization-associated protein-like n=1 Tax=Planoprotostelium fungivorum TaxID=1890364 RepID=A0A2P6MQR9_9EUKA|nr:axin interactor, dorsalization-associated protein-like [Planoprotostelium fungivorum]
MDNQVRSSWAKSLTAAVEHEKWGQMLEAKEAYEKLLVGFTRAEAGADRYSADDKTLVARSKATVSGRLKALTGSTTNSPMMTNSRPSTPIMNRKDSLSDSGKLRLSSSIGTFKMEGPVKIEDVKFLVEVIEKSYTNDRTSTPMTDANRKKAASAPTETVIDTRLSEEPDDVEAPANGTLLPPPPDPIEGQTYLTLNIEKVGLKNATQFLDPFLTISLRDVDGELLEPEQNTPISNKKQGNYVDFAVSVHLQTALKDIGEGSAVFVEFKHYKPATKKNSTRAWAFMEKTEMGEGQITLEIYEKPSDYKKKKLRLLSVKPLFVHLTVTKQVYSEE